MALLCRALFDLSVSHAGALTVKEGEKFLVLKDASAGNPHWWYAVNALGEMGYVPKNYVNVEDVSPESLLQELDDRLELLHTRTQSSPRHRNLLRSLLKIRSSLGKSGREHDIFPQEEESAPTVKVITPNFNPIITRNGEMRSDNCVDSTDLSLGSILPDIQKEALTISENGVMSSEHSIDKTDSFTQNQTEPKLHEVLKSVAQNEQDLLGLTNVLGKLPAVTECNNNKNTDTVDSPKEHQAPKCVETVDIDVQTQDWELPLPPLLVPELVDRVRSQTWLNYPLSILAVATALETLGSQLPDLSPLCNNIIKELAHLRREGSRSSLFESRDRERLLSVFHGLWSCKEDEQQRSWPLQEDETLILSELQRLSQLLVDADSQVCCDVIQMDNYECVHTLVTYYQMEPRRRLRLCVLGVLELMCCLDCSVVEQLLSSVLPTELATDILSHTNDLERFMVSAQTLSRVFCSGQPPPPAVYAHLNASFCGLLLSQLEGVLTGQVEEEVANGDLALLLALNLHLAPEITEDNFVLEAVRARQSAPALTEKLMLLINREEDPVSLPKSSGCKDIPNSVLKFLLDLFSDPICAQHFYVNDIKVLLDIIVRQLTDLPAGTQRRLDYLRLCKYILLNTSYSEHQHQRHGLQHTLECLLEHEDSPIQEKDFVRTLMAQFPHLFTFA